MPPSFTVTTPAPDRALVSVDEAKAALGISGNTSDSAVTALALRVSDMISRWCGVAAAGVTVPSLRAETLTQTFRPDCRSSTLVLARRFAASVTSIVEAGATLVTGDYELDGFNGLLNRIDGDTYRRWGSGKVVVVFVAGFNTVPEDLKMACLTAIREQWSSQDRDPLMKRERVDGVAEHEFWVGGLSKAGMGPFSAEVTEMLAPYRSVAFA